MVHNKKRIWAKAKALFLSASLILGSFTGLEINGRTVANADTLLISARAREAYILDASAIDPASFGGTNTTLDTAANGGIGDVVCGTDNFFTVFAVGKKNSLWDSEKISGGSLTADNGTYTQAVNLGGGLKTNGQAAIGFTITKAATVTVYDAVKAVNADKHHFQYCKAGGNIVTYYEMENDTNVVNKIVLELDEAGTYYIGGNNGGNILYVEVRYKNEEHVIDASTLDTTLFNAADASENPNCLKANALVNNYFSVVTTGNKVKYSTPDNVLTYGDETFTKSFRLDGGAKFATGQAAISFTAERPFRFTLVAAQKGSKETTLQYTNDNGATVVSVSDVSFTKEAVSEYSIDLPAGTYSFGSTQGLDIFKLSVEYIGLYSMNADDIDAALVTENDSTKIEADVNIGTDGFLTVLSKGKKNAIIKAPESVTEYANSVRLTGGAKVGTGQACLKLTLAKTAKITIVAAAKGSSGVGTDIGYVKIGDSALTAIGTLGEVNAIGTYTVSDVKPGEYYIGSAAGADIFEIKVEYDPVDEAQTPWADVAAPTVDKVVVNDEGQFVVDFTAVIDGLKGADYVVVAMLENGMEVSTTKLSSQSGQVTFTPLWSGNYTFYATSVRIGEAYKTSNTVAYDNYVLSVRKPVIVAEENKGNGSYYIDWFNLSEADTYAVAIKGGSYGDAYKTLATGITDADYLLEGLSNGTYTVKVSATRNSDGFVANYEKEINVTSSTVPQWYLGTFGSAQITDAVITEADGTQTSVILSSKDTATVRAQITTAPNITNTNGKLTIAAQASGKLADTEEGFSYYFTYIDPNTENFKLEAAFTINDVSLTPDNQTGFGIMATDIAGINFYGKPDYYHKNFNEVSALFWYAKAPKSVLRYVTGYTNPDTSNSDDVTRVVTEEKFSSDSNLNFEVGKEVTFSVEKTNEKYIITCNGETIELNDTSLLSVQEDGSMCIGVMTARKVGIEVKNIKFTTSESTGVSGGNADTRVTPSVEVFSSSTSGSKDYEYIYAANTDGILTVKLGTSEIYSKAISADTVVRVPVSLLLGENTITSEFKPSGTLDTLTSTDVISKTHTVTCRQYGVAGETIVVSATGSANGTGSLESPLDLATAVKYAQPGQTILLLDGTYTSGVKIERSVCGTAANPITMIPENVGNVVFDGAGITVVGSYWHIYGLEIKNNQTGVGIQISGNNNTVEMCTVHACANSGIQISRSGSANNTVGITGRMWPSDNLVKNCESYDNCDAGRNDADGFAAKLTCGEGNKFYGCIAHNNIDDGWDLFAKTISGEIGMVVIENCVAYNNGWLTTDDTTAEGYTYGEGNGFKLGGGYLKGGHQLINSITFGNGAKGITSNSCPDNEIYNSTCYGNSQVPGNGAYSVGLNKKVSDEMEWKVSGLISMADPADTTAADLIPFTLNDESNFIYDGESSWNNAGVEASDDWFVSVDMTVLPARNEDGTINMHGLLELKDAASVGSGAVLDVTSAEAKSVKPAVTTYVSAVYDTETVQETDAPAGSSATDSATATSSSKIWIPVVIILVLLAAGAGTFAAIKKNKKN